MMRLHNGKLSPVNSKGLNVCSISCKRTCAGLPKGEQKYHQSYQSQQFHFN